MQGFTLDFVLGEVRGTCVGGGSGGGHRRAVVLKDGGLKEILLSNKQLYWIVSKYMFH